MTTPDKGLLAEAAELAAHLADRARGIIQPYFRTGFSIETKPDATPVTIADRETEAALRAEISAAFPAHGIVGEEFGSERAEADYLWVLDPLDGTKAFVTGSPLFGCLIALLFRGRPVMGVIDIPILEERWTGVAGEGTRFSGRFGAAEARVVACPEIGAARLATTSPDFFSGEKAPRFHRVAAAAGIKRYGGDCYVYGLLASGYLDLVVESSLQLYDFAALVPVVEGAGGIMTDWQGRPLGAGSNGDVVVAGDGRVHAAAVELLNAK